MILSMMWMGYQHRILGQVMPISRRYMRLLESKSWTMLGQASIAVFLPMDKQALERVTQWYVKTHKLTITYSIII